MESSLITILKVSGEPYIVYCDMDWSSLWCWPGGWSIGKSLSPGIGSGIGSDSEGDGGVVWSWSEDEEELEESGSFPEVVLLVELESAVSEVLVELSVVELS